MSDACCPFILVDGVGRTSMRYIPIWRLFGYEDSVWAWLGYIGFRLLFHWIYVFDLNRRYEDLVSDATQQTEFKNVICEMLGICYPLIMLLRFVQPLGPRTTVAASFDRRTSWATSTTSSTVRSSSQNTLYRLSAR